MKKVRDLICGHIMETVTPGTLITDALKKMEAKRIHSLLVFNENQFRGIVTITDIAGAFGDKVTWVRDIMSPADKVTYVSYEDGLQKCRDLLENLKIHHLVVKDVSGEVKGVISTVDLMLADNEAQEEAAEIANNMPPT